MKPGVLIPLLLMIHFLIVLPAPAQEMLPKAAHPKTIAANKAMHDVLDFNDRRDFEASQRGFIASLEPLVITNENGSVWDMREYAFLDDAPVDTVNPSLWRQEQLNNIHGLFQIHPRIYQVRNFDLSSMTLIQGDTGWILIDPLLAKETAKAALDLATKHLGPRPVKAVIYTHSHVDHFGGVRGVVNEADVRAGKIKIIAPEGFMDHALAENVLAGNVMNRRAAYQFGGVVAPGVQGRVGSGLGKTTAAGTIGLIPPTDIIRTTGQELTVDGVRIVFQMATGSEAPAEFMFYFPDFKVMCLSEVTTRHMHNLYTLRGAIVRDALGWSKYINEAIDLFAKEAEMAFASHHWPTWGNASIIEYLTEQRDLYRFIHDETLRLANLGLTPKEIAETVTLPPLLAKQFHARGYYGTLSHNIKAVYQYYLGWFDGNPANLNPLPPVEAGKRYVQFMGGAEALLKNAHQAYAEGDFRWVAEVVNHLVFADPDNDDARSLQADALEQLGYQAESGVWRNVYLSAAAELRQGVKSVRRPSTSGPDVMRAMTLEMLFDYFSVSLKRSNVADMNLKINMVFTDIQKNYALELSNSVLNNTEGRTIENADATYTLTMKTFARVLGRQATFPELMQSGEIAVQGNPKAIGAILTNLEQFNPLFNIVTP